MEFLHKLHDPEGVKQLIVAGGYLLLFAIVFAETGLLIGFFLPGDSLLFIAGFCAANAAKFGVPISLVPMILILSFAAIAGDTVGYLMGARLVPLCLRGKTPSFSSVSIWKARMSSMRSTVPKTIVLARFVPIVRTFAPTVAGAANMDYRQFLTYNVVGGISWITSMSLLGYFLGNIPLIEKNLDKAVVGIVFLSILPMVLHAMKEKKAGQAGIEGCKAPKKASHLRLNKPLLPMPATIRRLFTRLD